MQLGPLEPMSAEVDLGHRMVKGATWMVLQRLAVRSIGLVSTIILARLLAPADFGLIALATSLAAILDSLLELGFDLALIQNQSDGKKRYNTAWTLSVLRGVFTALVLVAAAQPMADLYGDQRLVPIMLWLAVAFFISGLQNIGIVEFRKELQFDREFNLLVWSKVAGFVVTLVLAWFWRDYRALIAGIMTSKIMAVVLSYTMHPHRPWFSLAGSRDFLNFSMWLCLTNVVVIIKTRLDTFIVGKFVGPAGLGFYSVAYEISNLTMTELTSPISRVLFSGFSKISNDRQRLARSFLDSLGVFAFLGMPLAVGIALTAYQIVGIFLGDRWLEIVPLIQILTLYGLLNLMTANSSALYLAMGRADLQFTRNLPSIIVLVPALFFGVKYYGNEGAAWALVASAVVHFAANYWLIRRELSVKMSAALREVWRPFCATLVMFGAVQLLEIYWPPANGTLHLALQLAALALTGVTVYFAAVIALWYAAGRPDCVERRAFELVRANFASRSKSAPAAGPSF